MDSIGAHKGTDVRTMRIAAAVRMLESQSTTEGAVMSRYTLEFKGPKHTKWHALSVSALAPFPDAELAAYRQQIAEHITALRGVAVFADQIKIRMLKDGEQLRWDLYWSPEGRKIATVSADTAADAVKLTPKPHSKYKGEVYAQSAGTQS